MVIEAGIINALALVLACSICFKVWRETTGKPFRRVIFVPVVAVLSLFFCGVVNKTVSIITGEIITAELTGRTFTISDQDEIAGQVYVLAFCFAGLAFPLFMLFLAPHIARKFKLVTELGVRQRTTGSVAEKTCPRCAETVKAAAQVCRYCWHEFAKQEQVLVPAGQNGKLGHAVQHSSALAAVPSLDNGPSYPLLGPRSQRDDVQAPPLNWLKVWPAFSVPLLAIVAYGAYQEVQRNALENAVFEAAKHGCARDAPDNGIGGCTRVLDQGESATGATRAIAFSVRSEAFRLKGDLDQAITDATGAIRLNPNDAFAYTNRGAAYQKKGDLDRAIADHSEAIRLDPQIAFAYTNRGAAYQERGVLDRAIADHSEAIRLEPKSAGHYRNRGLVFEEKGDLKRAMADLNAAGDIDPHDAWTSYARDRVRAELSLR